MSGWTPPPLTGDELAVLLRIGGQVRGAVKGAATGRTSVASILARRMGRKANASLRALTLISDLTRPKPETFKALAQACGRPELAAQWQAAWDAVEHPRTPTHGGTDR